MIYAQLYDVDIFKSQLSKNKSKFTNANARLGFHQRELLLEINIEIFDEILLLFMEPFCERLVIPCFKFQIQ